MNNKQIAMQAIKEAMQILRDLARETGEPEWINHSISRHELDDLSRDLGYKDAEEVEAIVFLEEEADRDAYPGNWYDWV
jgi:hypothetical protein